MRQDQEAWIKSRFAEAQVSLEPFPNLFIRDVLPPEVYREMEMSLPSMLRWNVAAVVDTLLKSNFRSLLRGRFMQPHFGVRPPDRSHGFGLSATMERWHEKFSGYVELVDRLTIEAFQPHIADHRARLLSAGFHIADNPPQLGQSLFCQRLRDWSIDAHTHSLNQIIQSMIYFPLAGSHPDQGTVLYRVREPFVANAAEFMQTRCFVAGTIARHSIMPYERNALASFLNTPEAIHSTNGVAGPPRRYVFSCMAINMSPKTGSNIHVGC